MEWFKHLTASHDDPDISDAWDEFGDKALTVFWVTLEIYGREFNRLDNDGNLTISLRYYERKMRRKWRTICPVLSFYFQKKRILFSENGTTLTIKIPKFLEISSNWTKRQHLTPTEAPTEAPTAKEVEVEVEKKIYKRKPAPKTGFPNNLTLTKEMITYAVNKRVDKDVKVIKELFEDFKLHHKKMGSQFSDWYAAWQTWCRNHVKWREEKTAEEDPNDKTFTPICRDCKKPPANGSLTSGLCDDCIKIQNQITSNLGRA